MDISPYDCHNQEEIFGLFSGEIRVVFELFEPENRFRTRKLGV